jgi:hypothetical protein
VDVEVAMTAWTNNAQRLLYFERNLQALRENLSASRHTLIHILVCSEELPVEFRQPFEATCHRYGAILLYNANGPEIGKNHNFKDASCNANYVLSTECDFLLKAPLDISDDVDFLEANEDFAYIRYEIPPTQIIRELTPDLVELDTSSSYPYSNRPHLRHRGRFATLGPFVEHGGWGAQENMMGAAVRKSDWRIAGRPVRLWLHIGRFPAQERRWPEGESP